MRDQKRLDKPLSTLIHEADAVFSKYIRHRDREIGASSFHLKCFICGARIRIEHAQCMHYIDRDQMAVRYDEMNAHGGCEQCNCFDPDHKAKYTRAMIDKYGISKVVALTEQSNSLQKFIRHELLELIDTYKQKLKELK